MPLCLSLSNYSLIEVREIDKIWLKFETYRNIELELPWAILRPEIPDELLISICSSKTCVLKSSLVKADTRTRDQVANRLIVWKLFSYAIWLPYPGRFTHPNTCPLASALSSVAIRANNITSGLLRELLRNLSRIFPSTRGRPPLPKNN